MTSEKHNEVLDAIVRMFVKPHRNGEYFPVLIGKLDTGVFEWSIATWGDLQAACDTPKSTIEQDIAWLASNYGMVRKRLLPGSRGITTETLQARFQDHGVRYSPSVVITTESYCALAAFMRGQALGFVVALYK